MGPDSCPLKGFKVSKVDEAFILGVIAGVLNKPKKECKKCRKSKKRSKK